MADEPATPAIPEIPEDLDTLNDDALRGLHGELMAARAALLLDRGEDTPLARLREIRATVETIDTNAAAVASAVTERMEIATDPRLSDDAAPALPEPPAAEVPAPPPVPEPAVEAPAAEAEVPAPVDTAKVDEALSTITDVREPQMAAVAPEGAKPTRTASLVVAAGSRFGATGSDIGLNELGSLVRDLALKDDINAHVASLPAFESDSSLREEMLSESDGVHHTDELIRESQRKWREQYDAARAQRLGGVRTAAICDPLDIIREIPACAQASEPLADSLPSRPAGRLGFQYTPAMALATVASGVAVAWNETSQAAVDPTNSATWKPVVDIACPTPLSIRAEAITTGLRFDNTTDMSNPERIQDAMNKINAYRARQKTARLLQIIDALAVHFEFAAPYGALPGVVQGLLTTLPQGEYPERLQDGTPYLFYVPPGFLEALVIDQSNELHNDGFDTGAVATYIENQCAKAGWNVSVVDLEDVELNGQAPFAPLPTVGVGNKVALPALGGTTRPFKARLVAPEAALYFTTGEINYGVQRSPDLNRQNKALFFAEEFFGLAKSGCYPWYTIHFTLCPTGTRAASTTPFACPTSAS